MYNNDYRPPGLPSMSNHSLSRTHFEYRYALEILNKSTSSPLSEQLRKDMMEALESIEAELLSRNIQLPNTPTLQGEV